MLGTRRLTLLLAAGALIAIPVSGCGGGDDNSSSEATNASTNASTSAATAGGAGGTVNLSATDFKFTPSDPSVGSGEVTFVEKNDTGPSVQDLDTSKNKK